MATDGTTGDGSNNWGGHENMTTRTADGNVYIVYQSCPSTGCASIGDRIWKLMKRPPAANSVWTMVGSGPGGREPAAVFAGPNNQVYVVAWPESTNGVPTANGTTVGLPHIWHTSNGGGNWDDYWVPGGRNTDLNNYPAPGWIATDWPYAGAGISPNGQNLCILEALDGGPAAGSYNGHYAYTPAYFKTVCGNPVTQAWTTQQTTTLTWKEAYAKLLPLDDGSFQFISEIDSDWTEMGLCKPSIPWLHKGIHFWRTATPGSAPLTMTVVKELTQVNCDAIDSWPTDISVDTLGRIHAMYTYRDSTLSVFSAGGQAIFSSAGALLSNGNYSPQDEYPNYWIFRMLQDNLGGYSFMGLCCSSNSFYDYRSTDGMATHSANVNLPFTATYASDNSYWYPTTPRGGVPWTNFVDVMYTRGSQYIEYVRVVLNNSLP